MASELWKSVIGLGIVPELYRQDAHVTDAEQYLQAAQANQNLYAQTQNVPMDMDAARSVRSKPKYKPQANAVFTPHDRARSLFLARLGGIKGSYRVKPEDFLWCHITPDFKTVHVFFVFGDQAGTTSEDSAMFPSDTLITQFRLLIP